MANSLFESGACALNFDKVRHAHAWRLAPNMQGSAYNSARPIGSFQAVKHKCADMLVRVRLAEAAAREAAEAAAGVAGAPAAGVAAAVAHVVCSEAYMFTAAENIQVHGGIGFTWEHPAHLYFRRAKSSQLLFGGPAVYYERLLARMGI